MKFLLKSSLCLICLSTSQAGDWSGNFAIQDRYFVHKPLTINNQQHQNYLAMSAEPEYYTSWDNNDQSLTVSPFIRLDQHDSERTHGDIRELLWQKIFDGWEMKAGVSKVFWGVTESQHLVDVINQTDNVENIDGEDKLGQPMLSVSIEQEWGLIDLFILPYFRERNFSDNEGRPRTFPVIDADQSLYESPDKQRHVDYSARTFAYLGAWELGISYFDGTSREPTFVLDSVNNRLIPFYRQMQQIGVDTQITTREWLWKAEIIKRNWSATDFTALTAGFEYTIVGLQDTRADLGLVVEYLYDDRDENATSFFQNDILTGFRYLMNDIQSTEALIGIITDIDSRELIFNLEASRRLSQNWVANVEARGFYNTDTSSPAHPLRRDDFILLEGIYYF